MNCMIFVNQTVKTNGQVFIFKKKKKKKGEIRVGEIEKFHKNPDSLNFH